VACSRSASSAILAFNDGSIFRLVRFVVTRSVRHDGAAPAPTQPLARTPGSASLDGAFGVVVHERDDDEDERGVGQQGDGDGRAQGGCGLAWGAVPDRPADDRTPPARAVLLR
jgi:hypothetical protein